jgi:hypothetical protein
MHLDGNKQLDLGKIDLVTMVMFGIIGQMMGLDFMRVSW